jgi:truncated hemoglobin YjbI/ankyrin repeat protein
MEHRRLLAQAETHHPFVGSGLFEQIGGAATVAALIDSLYDGIESDPELRPLFGRDLTLERESQRAFFTEWLGGERKYTDRAHLPLKHRHDLLPITRALAAKWLAHFQYALSASVPLPAARSTIFGKARVLAMTLVNESNEPSRLRAKHHGSCLRYEPAVESLALARRGDEPALRRLLKDAPDVLLSVPHAASLLQLAVLGGRSEVVQLLLTCGVDVNKPAPIEALIFITPLCAARAKRRKEIEARLSKHGAQEDVFSHAYLGDLPHLTLDLKDDPKASQRVDPAVDALAITPIHHAVAGTRVDALRALLSEVNPNDPIVGGERALHAAVERESVDIVSALLERGVKAISVGAGRWVLHPKLAPLLAKAGATVDRSGAWIGLSCTGNQGRKDDPEYVTALLEHGARVDDKRMVGQGNDGGRATALHYASKAGFLNTIAVLLQAGADPNAVDDNGRTPGDWLENAAKSVDRNAVLSALRKSQLSASAPTRKPRRP